MFFSGANVKAITYGLMNIVSASGIVFANKVCHATCCMRASIGLIQGDKGPSELIWNELMLKRRAGGLEGNMTWCPTTQPHNDA